MSSSMDIFPNKENLFSPVTLTIAITSACNLCCAHCWVDAGQSIHASWIDTNTVIGLVEEFADLGGVAIRLTGGEPLLHPDWFEIVKNCAANNLKVLLQTNGMLFSDDDLHRLRDLGIADLNIQISLDGSTAPTHDLVRGEGAYVQTMQGIERLKKFGFAQAIALFFTEMHHNMKELPDLVLLADQLGLGSVSSGSLVRCGRGGESHEVCPPDPEQFLPLLQRYTNDPHFRNCYERLGNIAALQWCATDVSRNGCRFVENPYLTSTGVLYPCLMCHAPDYSVSNVFEDGLLASLLVGAQLWSSLQEISRHRVSSLPECLGCALQQSCAGGCMGRAWGSFGDFLVPEDRCQQRQIVSRWKGNS